MHFMQRAKKKAKDKQLRSPKSNAPLKLEIVIKASLQRGSLSDFRKFAFDLSSIDNQFYCPLSVYEMEIRRSEKKKHLY